MANELTTITYDIHTKDKAIIKIVGIAQARNYIMDNIIGKEAGVAVRFKGSQSEMLMSAKDFAMWSARLVKILANA
jgi:hypothetical protein